MADNKVLSCLGFTMLLPQCACVFCEPLVITRVVNLLSAWGTHRHRFHGNGAAGGCSAAAASHKRTHKAETSVTPNAPKLNTHAQISPSQTRIEPQTQWSQWPRRIIWISWANAGVSSSSFFFWSQFGRNWGNLSYGKSHFCIVLCRVALRASECFITCACLPLHVFVSGCVCIRISCGSDMGFECDRQVCKRACRCVRQDVSLQQMHSGLLRHWVHVSVCCCAAARNTRFNPTI